MVSGCLSAKSTQSIDPPLLFKGKHVKSSQDVPPHVRAERGKRPDSDYSAYETDKSSQDVGPQWDNQRKVPYGMPQSWGGHVISRSDRHALMVQPPLATVYPVLKAHPRVPDGARPSSWDELETSESNFPSDSDHSSTLTSGWRGSQSEEETVTNNDTDEEVICDVCSQAAAAKTCLTCNSSFCELDVRQHYTVKSLRRHLLTDACEEVEAKRCLHYKKPLDVFCRTDQMQICRICALGYHKGHDLTSLRPHSARSQISVEGESENLEQRGKVVPPPGQISFPSVEPDSVTLRWGSPVGLDGPKRFRIKWSSLMKEGGSLVIKDFYKVEINNLQFGQKYFFSVATEDNDGNLSEWVTASVTTELPAPKHLSKGHSEATALSLKWTRGDNMEGTPHQYLINVTSPGKEPLAIHTEDCYKKFSDLQPDTEYTISVSTLLGGQCSQPVSITIHTEPCFREVLSMIGLEDQYDNKLTLSSVLEIDLSDAAGDKLERTKCLPETMLKELMMLNTNARSVRHLFGDGSNAVNPLDVAVALFLCSDGFLQQDIVLKMALCQYAVPLLLPIHETREITLMLWSMREIVRTFRPSNQAFRKISCEERLALSVIPLVSFVRLGRTNLSKSLILNKLLSNTQQCHDTFYHRHMIGGNVPRRVSEGLVEISWYLPCGNRNIDKFTEPLAVANLRGDIRAFDKQFSFLCQTSSVVYIFCMESEADYFKKLEGKDVKANVILVSSGQGNTLVLKMMKMRPSLKTTNLSQKKKTETELTKFIQESISKMLENCSNKVCVAQMAENARCCGILVDEDSDECQSARRNVSKITAGIADASGFKDKQLTLQGHLWKALSWVETEYWRLRKAGNQNVEVYRKSLKIKEEELRRKQLRFDMTAAMSSFLHGVVTSEVQRCYFLKWLEMDLDDRVRDQVSTLQDQYKELRQTFPKDMEAIAEVGKQISVVSLRLGHFFRECGQLFECVSYLPEYSRQRKTVERLPALFAQMLLDGFPLELVDGDTANIPMKWITEVLTELHHIMQSNSKLKVIAILGAESSGKSTLLNNMFGVRFAVGKGACTRGAFLQLIVVGNDARQELGCDCIVIIDTEGLKPHQTAQDDHSHERDKEVASLAVGLSDAVIVCVSGDDSSQRDVLEMALHAWTRLEVVGRKPQCHFVQTNMCEIPAVGKKKGKEVLELLLKIIQKDTRMKEANITTISDVMEVDSDTLLWHIPPIWRGSPPMAPLSDDYSETVQALKKRLIKALKKRHERRDLIHLITQVESVWTAPCRKRSIVF
ncbi:up-regulator of cell proliferation-like [Antennarius striatus]|uniref:up-regulator of cell proliferation-like n=1 Tax=Antennarius striatus TaxID=241820 RepID=UPI0035B2EF35